MPQRIEQLRCFLRALGRYRDYLQALRRDEVLGEANQVSCVKHIDGSVLSIHVGMELFIYFVYLPGVLWATHSLVLGSVFRLGLGDIPVN